MRHATTGLGCERRTVLQAAAGALALLALLALPRAFARLPLLGGREPDAIALDFTPDATRIDPAQQPAFTPGSRCARCYFFQGKRDDDAAPCSVFAGWRVPAGGWCREFAPR